MRRESRWITLLCGRERQMCCECRYITPPGHGFLPRETAVHHQARRESHRFHHTIARRWSSTTVLNVIVVLVQEHILALVKAALGEAKITPAQLDCIAYTKVSMSSMRGLMHQSVMHASPRSCARFYSRACACNTCTLCP